MSAFILDCRVKICMGAGVEWESVRLAAERFYRDMEMSLQGHRDCGGDPGGVIYLEKEKLEEEQYRIQIQDEAALIIRAGDELGFVYGLLHLSRVYLGVLPFWFWNDQKFDRKERVEIPAGEYRSEPYRIRFRGWFINDEVLISRWDAGVSREYPWEMAFEALLRLGGNLVIPGTDRNSKIYAKLASDMGLWITHHHAEPLGAEMFARVYPDKNPSYAEYPELFEQLWEEGIERQRGQKVIWNIGFRGQGDRPFWEDDERYDTPESRGRLIGDIMRRQCELVKKQEENPVFCMNLYGEIMELYQAGFLELPEDVILIWADNGYGKMVSRRQGNHNPRIPALPPKESAGGNHGTYYHVSFYDLQAANHITMLQNSMEFVENELENAYSRGISRLWLINCSNVKPHVYPLDFIGNLWREDCESAADHRLQYLKDYYTEGTGVQELRECLEAYYTSVPAYGKREDEHAGDQFYNYVSRCLIHGWMLDGGRAARPELLWFAPADSFREQAAAFRHVCEGSREALRRLLDRCGKQEGEWKTLWEDTVLLQVKLHYDCLEGALSLCRGYEFYSEGRYQEAFYLTGQAAEWFEKADSAMREREHGKWSGFYENDCLTDVKQTAYCLRRLMGFIRNTGDGPHFYQWQREVTYSEEDKRVVLITNMENHMTDDELYRAMKNGKGQ